MAGHPFFIPGLQGARLPFLPTREQLDIPPSYMSNLLVTVYFDKLHYALPVLYKNQFLNKYRDLVDGADQVRADVRFLAVFYAVCACATSLLARDGGVQSLSPGIEHFEKAALLQLSLNDDASIEQIQCFALLSQCTASWNSLGQAWKYAGQAVRSAIDLGCHVGGRVCAIKCVSADFYIARKVAERNQQSRRRNEQPSLVECLCSR